MLSATGLIIIHLALKMAASASVIDMEDDLSCPVCKELFVDPHTPRTLPKCGHVCCEICLNQLPRSLLGMKNCPECRAEISPDLDIFSRIERNLNLDWSNDELMLNLSCDELASLPINFRLRNLAEQHLAQQQQLEKDADDDPPITMCPSYGHEKEVAYYCTKCNMLACEDCTNLKHRGSGHDVDGVKEMYDKQKAHMQSFVGQVDGDIRRVKGRKVQLETRIAQVNVAQEEIEKEIYKSTETCLNMIIEHKNELLRLSQMETKMKIAVLDCEAASIDRGIQLAETSREEITQMLNNKSDYNFLTQHDYLAANLKQIGGEEFTGPIKVSPYATVRFESHKLCADFGCILPIAPGTVRKLELLQTLDGFKNASIVACSPDGMLLVVCDIQQMLAIVYEKGAGGLYVQSRTLSLKSAKSMLRLKSAKNKDTPRDASVYSDGTLLVARGSIGIEVYAPDGSHQKTIRTDNTRTMPTFLLKEDACSVAIEARGKIFVGNLTSRVITEHNPMGYGAVLRTIPTKIPPAHIAIIEDTHIAISDGISGEVSVIEIGAIRESEQERDPATETLRVKTPSVVRGIAYDAQTECLLIAKMDSRDDTPEDAIPDTGVIEQYYCNTSSLIAIGCLATGLHNVGGMALILEKYLAVADTNTVKIYQIE